MKLHPLGRASSLTERVHSAGLEPMAVRCNVTVSDAPGEMRIASVGGSILATYGSRIVRMVDALLLSLRASVRLLLMSKMRLNSCSPNSAVNVVLNVSGPPSPEGDTGSTSANRSRAISSPFIRRTTSTFSWLSRVPMFENWPVTVTRSPGSGFAGLKLIPRPSARGARSVTN